MRMKNKMKDFEVESKEWWEVVEEYFQRSWRRIWLSIELMKKFQDISWKFIKNNFQILFVVVQQVQKHRTRMRRLKQSPTK